MRLFALCLASAAALLASACASAPRSLNDNQIIAGKRVGEVQLGMALADLVRLKGEPRSTHAIRETGATTYVFDGFTVTAHDAIYWIAATDARFRTSDGVGPGVEQIRARAALGRPQCVLDRGDTTLYEYEDIYYETNDASGKVTEIGVMSGSKRCAR